MNANKDLLAFFERLRKAGKKITPAEKMPPPELPLN